MCKHLPTTGDIFEMSPAIGKCLYIYMDKLLPKTGDIFRQSQFQSYQKMSVVWGKCLITIYEVAFAYNYWHFDCNPDSELPEMSVAVVKCLFIYCEQAFT